MLKLLKNQRTRGILVQVLVLVGVLGLLATFFLTARQNLLGQGIATGFGFLERSTGWPINFSLIEVSDRSPYWRMLLAGLLNTLWVGIMGVAAATVIGTVMGLARVSTNAILNFFSTIYVELFRNVPLILQIIFWYALLTHLPRLRQSYEFFGAVYINNRGIMLPSLAMSAVDAIIWALIIIAAVVLAVRYGAGRALLAAGAAIVVIAASGAALLLIGHEAGTPYVSVPELKGLRFVGGLVVKPEFLAVFIGMAVFGGAYIAEIVRGGLLSVDKGRIEAAYALGLRPGQVSRFVHLPLAIRAMLPALSNQYVWLMKATTLGVAIGYPDYFMVISTSINQAGQAIELLLLLVAGFLVVNITIATVMNIINTRLALKGNT
ncbi:MAG: ABC transporter permease subunit [Pseudomonadota bacterium]